MSIRLEDAGGNGRAARRNEPQLVGFFGRHRRQIAGQENEAAAAAHIDGFPLWLRRSFCRDQRDPHGIGGGQGFDHCTGALELGHLTGRLIAKAFGLPL